MRAGNLALLGLEHSQGSALVGPQRLLPRRPLQLHRVSGGVGRFPGEIGNELDQGITTHLVTHKSP